MTVESNDEIGQLASAFNRFVTSLQGPDARAHDQPCRQQPEQEDDEEQQRDLYVRLNIPPKIEGDVVPVAKSKQADDHRDQDPQQGL